jgi:hypothetical protein
MKTKTKTTRTTKTTKTPKKPTMTSKKTSKPATIPPLRRDVLKAHGSLVHVGKSLARATATAFDLAADYIEAGSLAVVPGRQDRARDAALRKELRDKLAELGDEIARCANIIGQTDRPRAAARKSTKAKP